MRDIDALRDHFQTGNTCPDCGARWMDETPTPGIVHRTRLCEGCAVASGPPLPRTPVVSSNVASLGYARARSSVDGILDVEFRHGGCYRYFHVPKSVYDALIAAPSIGSAFATLIKAGGYRYVVLPPAVDPPAPADAASSPGTAAAPAAEMAAAVPAPAPFTDLDTSTVDRERAAICVAEFLVWWEQAGRVYYRDDEGLTSFAKDAVQVIGGWRAARRMLRSMDTTTKTLIEAKGTF